MKITKFEHSALAFVQSGQVLLCDPVEFVHKLPDFTNVVAIVLTHNHSDHFQPEVIKRILAQNPNAKLFVTTDTVPLLQNSGIIADVKPVSDGDQITIGEFSLEFFGQNHASIIDGQIPCQNIGVVINQKFVNPGDSFDLPDSYTGAEVLFAPLVAPWCKFSETSSYVESAHPKTVIPVHDGLLSEFGHKVYDSWIKNTCQNLNINYILAPQDIEF